MTTQRESNSIQIPGAPTLGYEKPPRLVELPLCASPRVGLNLLSALAMALVGACGLTGALMLPMGLVSLPRDLATFVVLVVFWPIAVLMTAGFAISVTCIRDAVRHGRPVLVIGTDGLRDHRAGVFIPWGSVSRADIAYTRGGIGGVHLKLKAATRARQNPFRLGTAGFVYRRRPDELHVPVMMLDLKPHTLAHAIIGLVREHGGEVETRVRTPFGYLP